MVLISALSQKKYVAAALSGASIACLAFCFLLGTIQIKAVAERYQGRGHNVESAKKEAFQGVLKSETTKRFAKDAALNAL